MSFSTLSLHDFIQALASAQPTPGGGSAAAVAGAMGTGLLIMVAGLPRTRGNSDEERVELAAVRERLLPLADALERCADHDSEAFNAVMAAYRLPKASDEEKAARKAAITSAMRAATEAPLDTLRLAVEALESAETVATMGNPSAASDAGVGAGLLLAARQRCRRERPHQPGGPGRRGLQGRGDAADGPTAGPRTRGGLAGESGAG